MMKKYFVIGNPIDHSLSPKLHNYWLKENNIDAIYDKRKIDEKDLKNLIYKINEIELHIKKNLNNSLNLITDFILEQCSTKSNS